MSTQTSTFEFQGTHHIGSLNIDLEHYQHKHTGADHYHLRTDHQEKVFMVALRTVPQDNTGVAHILEHTVLCGSERFPVRDPFFMMTRRSLNTFMNAFTASDWTAYPFASENDKDFYNLLDVYLDAVFFPNLSELDFAQEGHRLALVDTETPDSGYSSLEYRGVVFNEMKGAMSSTTSRLFHTLTKYLFPTTTYHFNSGGEPRSIPKLTYEGLKAFYQKHYHPSNATFLTFGDLDVAQLQHEIDSKVMQRFERSTEQVSVPREERFAAPVSVQEYYPAIPNADGSPQDHVVVSWLLGDSTDVKGALEAHFLTEVLLDNSASPLRHALETTDLGSSVSPLCGLEDSHREMMMVCGLEGAKAEDAGAIEQFILDTLKQIAETGIPQEDQEAVLHQLELSQREIGGDGQPFGLQLIMTLLPTAIHRGPVASALDIDDALAWLREQTQRPDYIQQLIHRLLLDNPHRVRLTLAADAEYQAREEREEEERLEQLAKSMTDAERKRIKELNVTLEEHQNRKPDPGSLPKVTLADVPKALRVTSPTVEAEHHIGFGVGTNGLTYLSYVRPLPALPADTLRWLPMYSGLITELGHGEHSYTEVQRQQARYTGGVSAQFSYRPDKTQQDQVAMHAIISGKALNRNADAMNALMLETITRVRFDEPARIHELLQSMVSRRQRGITGNGHGLAMSAAASYWSGAANLHHQQGGLAGTQWLSALVKADAKQYMDHVVAALTDVHNMLMPLQGQLLAIAEPEILHDQLPQWVAPWQDTLGAAKYQTVNLPSDSERHSAWLTNTSVNFCAQAFATVPVEHPDSVALAVLSGILRNGFLHTAVREQGGAYGGGATHDLSTGIFRFYSYRDPRLENTFADFERSVEWFIREDHGYEPLEEAILGLVSSMDKPGSPAGEARHEYFNQLYGRDVAFRENLRARLLSVTEADLKRVAAAYLAPEKASSAVVTSADEKALCEARGMVIHTI
ncbi:insulinase family protein [Salinispirillum marinum]|uniref:Insulinase family protein n=2 Tax=Saccharospirillaceae TaxID=255527 RepID=A0ABV8BGN3_9GAMM